MQTSHIESERGSISHNVYKTRFNHEQKKLGLFPHKHDRVSFTLMKICSFWPNMRGLRPI